MLKPWSVGQTSATVVVRHHRVGIMVDVDLELASPKDVVLGEGAEVSAYCMQLSVSQRPPAL